MAATQNQVTRLLQAAARDETGALDALVPLLYDELRRLAASALRRERAGHTLQATALVHEAYVRLVDQDQATWRDRAHFLAAAAGAIRRILIDHARRRHAARRGGAAARVPLDALDALDAVDAADARSNADLLAIEDALQRLAAFDPQKARIVELRCFGGMELGEIAAALGTSRSTIDRQWALARAFLQRELAE